MRNIISKGTVHTYRNGSTFISHEKCASHTLANKDLESTAFLAAPSAAALAALFSMHECASFARRAFVS